MILDANARIGDSWRKRWDSLRLFTPAKFDGLDGMPFPARGNYFPTKDEMANYLEAYARRFQLAGAQRVRVERLFRARRAFRGAGWNALELRGGPGRRGDGEVPARQGARFAAALSREIVQLHSHEYRNPASCSRAASCSWAAAIRAPTSRWRLARGGHKTWMAGRDNGQVPVSARSASAGATCSGRS